MRKHRKLLIALACFGALIAFVAYPNRDDDPHYQGRSLSEWLSSFHYGSDFEFQTTAAADAVRAIGTNAIPPLLIWIRYKPTFWQREVLDALPGVVRSGGLIRADNAVRAFALLSTNAYAAVPDLSSLMRDKAHPQTAKRAIEALSCMGPPAFPALAAALTDTNQQFRVEIAMMMEAFMAPDVGTNTCLLPLRTAMNDPDPDVRTTASALVTMLAPPGPETNAAPR